MFHLTKLTATDYKKYIGLVVEQKLRTFSGILIASCIHRKIKDNLEKMGIGEALPFAHRAMSPHLLYNANSHAERTKKVFTKI